MMTVGCGKLMQVLEVLVVAALAVYCPMESHCAHVVIWRHGQRHSFMQRPVHPSFGQVKTVVDG